MISDRGKIEKFANLHSKLKAAAVTASVELDRASEWLSSMDLGPDTGGSVYTSFCNVGLGYVPGLGLRISVKVDEGAWKHYGAGTSSQIKDAPGSAIVDAVALLDQLLERIHRKAKEAEAKYDAILDRNFDSITGGKR